MILILDTNIWLSELGLRSGAGSAVRFYLNHRGARLAVPEVVRLEVERNLRARLLEHIDSIRADYGRLLTAFGKLREIVLPTEEDVYSRVESLFDAVGVDHILNVPFTLDSARSSFLKTIQKVPPSDKNQEFKDGVLWADCLALLQDDDVTLVTADKAFYRNRRYEEGLAENLQLEISGADKKFRIIPAVTELLQSLGGAVTLNDEALTDAFLRQHRESIDRTLNTHGFELEDRLQLTRALYATEDPKRLFISFSIEYQCNDARGEGRKEAVLHLKGDGIYLPAQEEFVELRNFGEGLTYLAADGTEKQHQNHILFADGLVIGHRVVTHTVRFELPEDEH